MRLPLYRFGEFELDPAFRELLRRGERVPLPPKSFECLAYLIAHRDRAVGRDELIAAVWGRVEVSDAVVAQTLLRARKALDDTDNKQATVRTVPRFGYHWVASVQEIARVGAVAPVPVTAVESNAPAPASESEAALSNGTRKPPSSRIWLAASALLLIAALAWALFALWPKSSPETKDVGEIALVLPVTVTPADAENAWVRLGAMDYIASRVRRAGLKVLPSDQTLHLSAQLGEPATTDDAALQKLKMASGARWIVAPEASRDRRGWRVRLRLYESGEQHLIEARAATPLAAAAAVTDLWLRRLNRNGPRNEPVPSPLTERVQQIDAELLAGQLVAARRLIEAAPADQRSDTRMRVREGQLEYRAGRIDDAARIFQTILEGPASLDSSTKAKALMGLGAVEIRRRKFPAAEARYTEALAVLEANPIDLDDPSMLGNAYNGRGVAQVEQGKMEAAVRDMGMARIAMQRAGDLVEAAMVDSNLGIIETKRRHYPQAIQEFDHAIAVYERFEVRDYLAATLTSKAATQLKLVQPGAALASIERADALIKSLEDPELAVTIATTRASVLLANGRLRDAEKSIAALRSLGLRDTDAIVQELMLELLLAQGAQAQALALVQRRPDATQTVGGSLALAAVQAALRNKDADTARYWLARAPAEADDADPSWDLARALLAKSEGQAELAMQAARRAAARAEREGSPDERVRAGVLQARLLLSQGQPNAAAAVLGDLDTFAGSDYRVAWTTLALYRALGDPSMTANALARAQALRGERDLAIEPVL